MLKGWPEFLLLGCKRLGSEWESVYFAPILGKERDSEVAGQIGSFVLCWGHTVCKYWCGCLHCVLLPPTFTLSTLDLVGREEEKLLSDLYVDVLGIVDFSHLGGQVQFGGKRGIPISWGHSSSHQPLTIKAAKGEFEEKEASE